MFAQAGCADGRAVARLFSYLHSRRSLAPLRRVVDRLDRRIFRGHDVALLCANRDPVWRERAEHYSQLLTHRQYDQNVHDLGFIFLNTYRPWYELTGESQLRDVLVQAGEDAGKAVHAAGKIPALVRGA